LEPISGKGCVPAQAGGGGIPITDLVLHATS
jgi:hypothetical protein